MDCSRDSDEGGIVIEYNYVGMHICAFLLQNYFFSLNHQSV